MEAHLNCNLIDHFATIDDLRDARWTHHRLIDILTISLCATICGAEGWEDIENFGHANKIWFKRFLALPAGIPHHDTFRRVFERIRPEQFEASFESWVQSVRIAFKHEIVAIDGKSMRGSYTDSRDKSADMLHIVSAWAGKNSLILGQVKTSTKSNEITAIPQLLKKLELSNCIVTIDAMGCQRKIAKEIKNQGADYILTVKENQKGLHKALENSFNQADSVNFKSMVYDQFEHNDFGHGRIEKRKCTTLPMMYLHNYKERWEGFSSLVRIESERINKCTSEVSRDVTYCISSLPHDAQLILTSKRAHWGIENTVHWVLDVIFKEDDSRVRDRYSAQNLTMLRRLAINMVKRESTSKKSIRQKRMMAGWDRTYLEKILRIN